MHFSLLRAHCVIYISQQTFHKMNFSQLHERLRLEMLRRIDRGGLSGALLARQTGFRQAHISNFLHRKRTLSLAGLDRILAAQMLSITDLIPLDSAVARTPRGGPQSAAGASSPVPIVKPSAAIHEPQPLASSGPDFLEVPSRVLDRIRSRRSASRRGWLRFVAIRLNPQLAAGMDPLLTPDTITVIDRHYNSLLPYRNLQPSLYAIRSGNALLLRFAHFELNRLVLRPYNIGHPVHLLALGPHEVPSDVVVGRICVIQSEL